MGKRKAALPMRFEPSDFSTDKYRCVNVINLRDRCPVIIMASESCDPPYYRVVDGSLEMFYLWKYCSPYGRRIAHGNRKT